MNNSSSSSEQTITTGNRISLDLVWHSKVGEDKWIRFLLSGVNGIRESNACDWTPSTNVPSLHVLSTNDQIAKQYARDLFGRLHGSNQLYGIFHLSDEWFKEDTSFYRGARFCLRNYWCSFVKNDDIIYIPLGYPNNCDYDPAAIVPASKRTHLCFFIGQIKASRFQLLRAFRNFEGFYYPRHFTPDNEYAESLFQTVFSFCPMGNATPDTWRLYESLEAGAIPIVEHRLTVDYFKELLGPHPIPSFASWYAARSWVEHHKSSSFVDSKQSEIQQWWQEKKVELQKQIGGILRQKFQPEYKSSLEDYAPSYTGMALGVRWKLELLRYLNWGAIPYRSLKIFGLKTFKEHPGA